NRVHTHTVFDAMERVILSLVYTDIEGRTAEFRTEKGHLASMGSTATTVTFERIEDGANAGQDRTERYTNVKGEPKRFFGAYGTRLEYSPVGLVTRAQFTRPDGRLLRTIAGFAEVRIRYDEAGSPIEFSLFDENSKPVRGHTGFARRTRTYDSRGNLVEEA